MLCIVLFDGVLLFRKSCWTMRFIDWWLAHRSWCAYRPLHDNGPMAIAVVAAMRGLIQEDEPSPLFVTPPKVRSNADAKAVCTAAWNITGLSFAGSRVCVTHGGFGNRTGLRDGRGFNSPWYPGDLLAHFLGSVYGEVRHCFQIFVTV